MNQQYVPLDKRSKRKQKEFYDGQRKDWNGVNPITKTVPCKKVYNRKKSGQWYEHEPLPGFLFCAKINIRQKRHLLEGR